MWVNVARGRSLGRWSRCEVGIFWGGTHELQLKLCDFLLHSEAFEFLLSIQARTI